MTLYFHNPGIIDIRGATIAGLSAKEGDNPIGLFGTGLKYSIACILRWGGTITVHAGEMKYQFGAADLNFRGKDFQQIHMITYGPAGASHEQPLGFTTEYGKQWEPWQVYRELYANALDEGGDVLCNALPLHESFDTVIEVECDQLQAIHAEKDSIILPRGKTFNFEHRTGKITAGTNKFLYYRGVRVRGRATILTWNIMDELRLTEDRTLAEVYNYQRKAARLLMVCDQPSLIQLALNAPDGNFEAELDFNQWDAFSPEFLDIASKLYKQAPRKHARLKEFLAEHKPESVMVQVVNLSPLRAKMLERAKQLVAKMGFPDALTDEVIVADLGSDTLGQYKDGKIYLDPKVFDQGTKQVVSTLYEEHMHKATGLADCTYQMQTHLFNIIASLYEEHVFGEPM